jgi:hypothetical protein
MLQQLNVADVHHLQFMFVTLGLVKKPGLKAWVIKKFARSIPFHKKIE